MSPSSSSSLSPSSPRCQKQDCRSNPRRQNVNQSPWIGFNGKFEFPNSIQTAYRRSRHPILVVARSGPTQQKRNSNQNDGTLPFSPTTGLLLKSTTPLNRPGRLISTLMLLLGVPWSSRSFDTGHNSDSVLVVNYGDVRRFFVACVSTKLYPAMNTIFDIFS